jgi:hypothetical protein
MTDIKASIRQRIEEFFGFDDKARKACLNLVEFIFAKPAEFKRMSAVEVAEVMDVKDHNTVKISIDFCAGPLGLIDTYAEVSLRGGVYEINTQQLNDAVRSGRMDNPKTGVREIYHTLTHPLYKTNSAIIAD